MNVERQVETYQDKGNAGNSRTVNRPPDVVTKAHMQGLAPLLEERGLTVTDCGNGIIEVRNPAGDPTAPRSRAMNPGMKQRVELCDHHGDGELWWVWQWAGPERGGPPDLEPMVPAGYVDEAARRITRVLHVDGADR